MSTKKLTLSLVVALVAAAPALAQETVNIGYSGPLSGGAAQYGEAVLEGMQMAAADLNRAGFDIAGKKVRFHIVALDDQYNPSETAINVRRLVQEDGTAVILCPHSGGDYAIQMTNRSQNLLLLAYTSVPQITARGNPLTIRIPPKFTLYMAPFIHYEMAHYGKAVAIANTNTDYGNAWANAFEPAWKAAGGTIVSDTQMSYNSAADFYSSVSRAIAAKPDVMFIGGPSQPTGLVVKQARELGFKGGFIVMDQAKLDEVAKAAGGDQALDGAIGVMPLVDDQTPAAKSFVARFRKTHDGRTPSQEEALNYTAVWATAYAMKIAGTTTDGKAIRSAFGQALKSLPPQDDPDDLTGVDAEGGATMGKIPLAVVENGRIEPYADVEQTAAK